MYLVLLQSIHECLRKGRYACYRATPHPMEQLCVAPPFCFWNKPVTSMNVQQTGWGWKDWVGFLQRGNGSAITFVFFVQPTAAATAAWVQDDRFGEDEEGGRREAAWGKTPPRTTGSNVTAPPRPGDWRGACRERRQSSPSGSAVYAGNGGYPSGWGSAVRAGGAPSTHTSPLQVRRRGAAGTCRCVSGHSGPRQYRRPRERVHLVAETTAHLVLLQSLRLLLWALRQAPNHRRTLRAAAIRRVEHA